MTKVSGGPEATGRRGEAHKSVPVGKPRNARKGGKTMSFEKKS